MKEESKTIQQQRAYFLYQEMIAQAMNEQWVPLASLVAEIQPRPTKTALHEVFKAILYSMYQKESTTWMTREEMKNCLEVYDEALANLAINLPFPDRDKQNLLSFYS
jgi:hypothetical protein